MAAPLREELIFDVLPTDLQKHVFEYLTPEDLAKAAQVSTKWKVLANNPHLWRKKFEREKTSWKSFQSQNQPVESSEVQASSFSTMMKFASELFDYFRKGTSNPTPTPSSPTSPSKRDHSKKNSHKRTTSTDNNDEDELRPNIDWKSLYLQQYIVNSEGYQKKNTGPPKIINSKDKPFRVTMIGEGAEKKGSAKRFLYNLMWNAKSPFPMTGMYPGVEGVGGGVGFTVNASKATSTLNLVAVNKYEDRKLFEQMRPMWASFFHSSEGVMFVIDSNDNMETAKQELHTFIQDGWIMHETPLLILVSISNPKATNNVANALVTSTNSNSNTHPNTSTTTATTSSDPQLNQDRTPAFVAHLLGFDGEHQEKIKNWNIRAIDMETMEGVREGIVWLTDRITSKK